MIYVSITRFPPRRVAPPHHQHFLRFERTLCHCSFEKAVYIFPQFHPFPPQLVTLPNFFQWISRPQGLLFFLPNRVIASVPLGSPLWLYRTSSLPCFGRDPSPLFLTNLASHLCHLAFQAPLFSFLMYYDQLFPLKSNSRLQAAFPYKPLSSHVARPPKKPEVREIVPSLFFPSLQRGHLPSTFQQALCHLSLPLVAPKVLGPFPLA